MFVSDLRHVGVFLRFPSPIKTDRHDITEILLKVALNTITLLDVDVTKQNKKGKKYSEEIMIMSGKDK